MASAPASAHRTRSGLSWLALGLAAALGAPTAWAAPHQNPRGEVPPARGTVGPDSRPRWPKPLFTRTFLKIRLRHAKGTLTQERTQEVIYPRALKRQRVVGRFLAKVYAGESLIDVVPFNFPLLAPAESFTPTGRRIAMQMEANLVTTTEIEIPLTRAVDRVLIRDVGTGRQWTLDHRARGKARGDPPAPHARPASPAGQGRRNVP